MAAILDLRLTQNEQFVKDQPSNDLQMVQWFQKESFKNIFPLGSCVKLCPVMAAAILDFQTIRKIKNIVRNDPCTVLFQLSLSMITLSIMALYP